MPYYLFDRVTRAYTGYTDGVPDPLREGVFQQPAFSVTEAPAEPDQGYWPQLQGGDALGMGGTWQNVEDHRGERWFDEDGAEHTIHELGPVPFRLVSQTPPPSPLHRWTNGAWGVPPMDVSAIRVKPWPLCMALNQLGLRQQVEAAIAESNDQDVKDAWVRASEFARSHPLVIGFGPMLNKSPAEIDQVFLLAYEIGRSMP